METLAHVGHLHADCRGRILLEPWRVVAYNLVIGPRDEEQWATYGAYFRQIFPWVPVETRSGHVPVRKNCQL